MNMTNEQLLRELSQLGYLKSPRIEEAMKAIFRQDFVPVEYGEQAYENKPLPIGFEQTMSQPLVVAFMLELLALQTGETVLEIGTGTGWQTMLLSFLSSPSVQDGSATKEKTVISVERIPELSRIASAHAKKYPEYEQNILFVEGDGSKGYNDLAPYDRIICGASADEVPDAWKEQIKIGGKIVLPMGERIVLLEKTGKNDFVTKEFFGFRFVPLVRG